VLKLVSRFGGDPNEKELDRLQPLVEEVGNLEPQFTDLADGQLRGKTEELIHRLAAGDSLDDLLPEAFAAVREASKRTTSMRHFDVQILGGIILHQGKVVEMKTGEGKTLVATLPLYLNALAGHGAHLITVNDYLARRDVQWMGPIYHLLGLSVGLVQQGEGNAFVYDPEYTRGSFKYLRPVDRGEAYLAHITYGTNHEFGFDYLRDNLAYTLERRVQREPHYAIIDEVDNILIDEARTPLIISGPSDEPLEEYKRFARIARKLRAEVDYELDERESNVILTEAGLAKVESETGIENIYDEANYQYVHYMEQALRAQVLFHKGRDYIRQGQRIVLVDEFTGRLMPDRRLSEGLHQAIEAKEGVPIRARMMTQATVTLQNYFRMYEKLAGMTGTASTEAEELDKIYELDVIVLPTNVEYMARSADSRLVEQRRKEDGVEIVVYCNQDDPDEVIFYKRADYQDAVYKTEQAKWEAITGEIKELHQAGRPVLVGTTSVEKSELLSALLKAKGIPHEVLNAKNHTREAAIIAGAGEPKAVTIATNMAGRGVDIKLGGELSEETIRTAHRLLRGRGIDPYRAPQGQLYSAIAEVDPDYVRRREQALELGGLHVLGTERHEARRIDNQLRGRAGRQGEPGSSRFFLSLEDDLMRRFGGPSVASMMDRLGVEEDIPIEHGMVSKTIEGAQTKVEGYNFDIRKHLLEYDDVLNRQRELIYGRRYRFLTSNDLEPELWDMLESELARRLDGSKQEGDDVALLTYLNDVLPLALAPPDAPFSYQFPFLGKLTCFPPFTILFLGNRLATHPRERISETLLDLSTQASDEYRQHLMESVVREPFQDALDQYNEILSQYIEALENKVEDYASLTEEQGRSLSSQDLLQYVQNVFPIPLKVKASELRNLSMSETTDELVARLRHAYHQELADKLLRMVQARTPADLKLDQIRASDVAPEQLEALVASSSSNADDSQRTRLTQLMEGKRALLDTLFQVNTQADLDLNSLRIVLGQALETAYDRWAQRQLEEMSSAVSEREARLQSASEEDLLLILLGVVYSERADYDKGHLRRLSFAPRFPLPFLALPLLRDLRQEELREIILDQLESALTARQDTWGRQEVSRLGQSTLGELDNDLREGLAEHLGESILEAAEGQTVGELDQELHKQVRAYLGLRQLEGVRLGDLDSYEDFERYLERELGTELADSNIDPDERLAAQTEEHLLAEGYFEDEDARRDLSLKPIAQLDRTVQEGIARRVGLEELSRLGDAPVAAWDADSRLRVKEFLQGQGHFVDEQKVQRFFVHGNMEELGEQTAQQACAFIAAKQLRKWDNRTIASLKGDLRETVLGHLQQQGLLVDEAKRERFQERTLAQIDEATGRGLTSHLGERQLEAAGTVSALPGEALDDLEHRLREEDYFTDQDLLTSVQQAKVSDLDEDIYQAVRQNLLSDLEERLGSKLIGEMPPYLQQIVRRYLRGTDYFVDEEKIGQADSLTLSTLDASTVRELEQRVGEQIVSSFEQRKFMNLDQEVRESILHYLDLEGLFRKKKKREQFVKRNLADLDKGIKDGLAYHLGRERLAELREVRLSNLPDDVRQEIWGHLKDTGYFVDAEKEEYLEIEELKDFDPELRRGLLAAVEQGIDALLSERVLADLPEELQVGILQRLEQEEYFLDRERLAQFQSASVSDLEPEACTIVCQHLGRRILAGIEDQRVSDLSGDLRLEVEAYLEASDYFVDQAKKDKFMQRRIVDLGDDVLEGLIQGLGRQLALETMASPIAELDKNDREYLRDYLDSVGHFLHEEAVGRFEQGMLTDLGLDTREQEALASWLGQKWVDENGDRRLSELEHQLQDEIQRSLRSSDYFLDSEKLQRFREEGIAELDEEMRDDVVRHVAQKRAEDIADRRFDELDEETRHDVERFLASAGFGLDDEGMAEFEGRKLADLDEELAQGLARYLGHQRLSELGDARIAHFDEQSRSEVERFVGRQLMHRIEKQLMLGFTSKLWVDYLTAIEDLRQGIGLQAYAQMDPLVEYKRRAFGMFGELNDNINRMVVGNVFRYPPQPLRLAQAGQR
jgi:preprotein translocase subunit SecA